MWNGMRQSVLPYLAVSKIGIGNEGYFVMVREKVAAMRKKHGFSAAKLGEMLGVTQSTISRYEKGYVKIIPRDKLELLCSVFNCSLEELVGNDPLYQPDIQLSYTKTDPILVSDKMEVKLLGWFRTLSSNEQAFLIEAIDKSAEPRRIMIIN